MLIKSILILVSILLPPLGLFNKNRKEFFRIVSLFLWLIAVYLFFDVSVIFGVMLHLTIASFSILNVIMTEGGIQFVRFNKTSWLTLFGVLLISISFIYSFYSRVSEKKIPVVNSERTINGKKLFSKCLACHRTNKDNFVGPHLEKIYGRRAGSVDNYIYSKNLAKANFVWSGDQLLRFLTNQNELIPDTRMIISPMPKDDILDIIEYLKTQ